MSKAPNFLKLMFIVPFLMCCSEKKKHQMQTFKPRVFTEMEATVPDVPEPLCDTMETVIDSSEFGRKGKTKLELRLIFTDTSSFLNLKLFTKKGSEWTLSDAMNASCFVPVLSPVFTDMNGDGYKDLLFHSSEAARGANTIQTLVLFDAKRNKLKRIVGDYPNMEYNPKLKCINSWGFHAGSITYFLRIENDSLLEFAHVTHFDKRITVDVIDQNGKWREITDIPQGVYRGQNCFKNYDPVEW